MKSIIISLSFVLGTAAFGSPIHSLSGHYTVQGSDCSPYSEANIFFDFLDRWTLYLLLFEKESFQSRIIRVHFGTGGEGRLSEGQLHWGTETLLWSHEQVKHLDSEGCMSLLKRSAE